MPLLTKVPYRPMGKNAYKPAPWTLDGGSDYVPAEMSLRAMKVGLSKIHERKELYNEDLLDKTFGYILSKMQSIWVAPHAENIMTFDSALETCNMSKGPGFPYYYDHTTKGEVVENDLDLLEDRVNRIIAGEPVPCCFTLTAKTELRHKDKVREHKTRVFMASDFHHLVASKILYERQNQRLLETIGQHPFDVGIQLPGPQYVTKVASFEVANDGDVSGNDLRFNLQIANRIRLLRHRFLPPEYREAGLHLYSSTFCGFGIFEGDVYRVYHQKSGGLNTASDNSFKTWASLVLASFALHPHLSPDQVGRFSITSDDVLVRYYRGKFREAAQWLSKYNEILEADDWNERPVNQCVYLSHHLEKRFVLGVGDFVVAAGNLPKLMSSVNWIKTNPNLTFEESCVAHLLGLRMCLFPWAVHFEEVDHILGSYLSRLPVLTPVIKQLLVARFDDFQMSMLHTGVEFSFLSQYPQNQVLKCVRSLIKQHTHA